jgi:hypothetical protein
MAESFAAVGPGCQLERVEPEGSCVFYLEGLAEL